MKKRLPTLILFFSAAILLLILFLWPKSEAPKDTDGDGFPDTIDKCIDIASQVNNGCPENAPPPPSYQVDNDGDGFFNISLQQGETSDPDDKNPCVPHPECNLCDEDDDHLTREEELAKGTDPEKKDSDGDGINDDTDKCPMTLGHPDNQGCVLVIDADLSVTGKSISWNPLLKNYTDELKVSIFSFKENKYIVSDRNIHYLFGSHRIDDELLRAQNYRVELKVKPQKGIRFTNLIIQKTTFTF